MSIERDIIAAKTVFVEANFALRFLDCFISTVMTEADVTTSGSRPGDVGGDDRKILWSPSTPVSGCWEVRRRSFGMMICKCCGGAEGTRRDKSLNLRVLGSILAVMKGIVGLCLLLLVGAMPMHWYFVVAVG